MRRAKGRGKRADMGMLVAETATRLRSGATPEGAWRQTLERAGLGAHADLDADGVPAALRKLWLAPRWRRTVGEEVRLGVPPAIAVCRMSKLTGAPTADVLESCAAGITEAGEAAAARRVAMAGPKASARILALLPVLGLCVGTMIGAPGRTRCWMVASSAGRTEATRRTWEASTSQPKRRFWNSAVTPAMRGSSQVGW